VEVELGILSLSVGSFIPTFLLHTLVWLRGLVTIATDVKLYFGHSGADAMNSIPFAVSRNPPLFDYSIT